MIIYLVFILYIEVFLGQKLLLWGCILPQWLSGKESSCCAADLGSASGLGRSPEGGHGSPLQYSCLGNPRDRSLAGYIVRGPQRVGHDWDDWACTHARPSETVFCSGNQDPGKGQKRRGGKGQEKEKQSKRHLWWSMWDWEQYALFWFDDNLNIPFNLNVPFMGVTV